MTDLNLMEIERFAVHDGPGIRTVIFLKGCPLHCPWCSNPESQTQKRLLFHDETKCIHCETCLHVCPKGILAFCGTHLVAQGDCKDCEECRWHCQRQAISFNGESKTISQILHIVTKDRSYYENSHGGVTLSGGEPLYQDTVPELLQALKQEGIHTCVETTLHISNDMLQKTMPYIDLFYVDYKHADGKILQSVTGANLSLIEANLKRLKQQGKEVVVRIPVIPGFNDALEMMETSMLKLKALGIDEVHLLPFHNYGKKKYQKMGLPYAYGEIPSLASKELLMYKACAQKCGLHAVIY